YKAFKVEDRNYKEYMYYGPIPQSEIQKWTELKQNKGWELNNK
ncbi:RagB/SusD family nutrient uptake outer membrane protein, partial [Segatella baroniae]